MANQKNDDQIDIKFMDPSKVNRDRQNFLMLKQVFLLRQNYLKSYGVKGMIMGKIESWLDDNVDQMYNDWARNHKRQHLIRRISKSLQFVFNAGNSQDDLEKQ